MTTYELDKFIEDHADFSIKDILLEMEMNVDGDGNPPSFEAIAMPAATVCMYTELLRRRLVNFKK